MFTYEKTFGVQMTAKQMRILKALAKGNDDGSPLDVYQLIERCAPGTTRGSMITSMRHLASHGLVDYGPKISRSRGPSRRTYVLTPAGVNLIRPSGVLAATV